MVSYVVLTKLCTLKELETYYSIDDLYDMIEMLEFKHINKLELA